MTAGRASSGLTERLIGEVLHWSWAKATRWGAVKTGHRRARRFAAFGRDSVIAFPPTALHGEHRIGIGAGSIIGPHATLSVGMPDAADADGPLVVRIGDRCVLGRGIAIVAHHDVLIGEDTVAGHGVYITDQNHGYEDVTVPVKDQLWKEAPVRVGPGSWLGHGVVLLPGARLGAHVVVAAGAVVTAGEIPDHSVVAGVPARVVRRHVPGRGWVPTTPDGAPVPD